MSKSQNYQVLSNRIRFKCHECQTRRHMAVPPGLRKRSVRCHKCGKLTKCVFNRRIQKRQQQCGKATAILRSGKEVTISLQDISSGGVGFDIVGGVKDNISLKQEISLRCSWNPRLLRQERYKIKNIRGQRIGVGS